MQPDSPDVPHATGQFPPACRVGSREYGVLIADDDAGIRDLLAFGLRRSGCRVLPAADGLIALEIYRTHRESIDAALLDVHMPGLDGLQTCAKLRKLSPRLLCCFMSGDFGNYSEQTLLDLGAAAIFNKPFRVNDICQTLLDLLRCDPDRRIPQVKEVYDVTNTAQR